MNPYNRQATGTGSGSSIRRTSYASVAASAAGLASQPQAPTPAPTRSVTHANAAPSSASAGSGLAIGYPYAPGAARSTASSSVAPGPANPATTTTTNFLQTQIQASPHSRHFARTSVDDNWSSWHPHGYTRTIMPPFSSSMGYGGFSGSSFGLLEMHIPPLIIPSYLQGSRYAERLQDSHRARVSALRDAHSHGNNNGHSSARSSNPGSLSTSASSSHLPKMVPSHRGMTHDIIERAPLALEEQVAAASVAPLPTRWSETDRHRALDIRIDGLEVAFTGADKQRTASAGQGEEACAVRTDVCIPRGTGVFYWECGVTAKNKDVLIGIGFCGPKTPLERLPGWEHESWGYHGDDGHLYNGNSTGKQYGTTQHRYSPSDIIGCGINFRTGQAFFTKNGVYLGVAFNNIVHAGGRSGGQDKLFPCVGMKRVGESIKVNFGQRPFVYDIDAHVRKEREEVEDEIRKTGTASLFPPLEGNALVQKLVAQYLSMDGYVDTARKFAAEVKREERALGRATKDVEPEQDMDAIRRQRIRAAVLRGDIDAALKLTKIQYEKVLKENENVYFKLKCRKYVEMIRRVDEQRHQPFIPAESPIEPTSQTSVLPLAQSTHFADEFNDVFGHGMELDEQLQLSISGASNGFANDGEAMDTDNRPVASQGVGANALAAADIAATNPPGSNAAATVTEDDLIRYGRELQLEFKDDPRREVKKALEDTLALIAYENPRESPLAWLMDESGRAPVAEELNAAILVSLGKASSSGLERVVQQTEVLVDELAEDGGCGALINVRGTYLR